MVKIESLERAFEALDRFVKFHNSNKTPSERVEHRAPPSLCFGISRNTGEAAEILASIGSSYCRSKLLAAKSLLMVEYVVGACT